MLTDAFLRSGEAARAAALVELRAGPLRLHYDPVTGALRWFRLGKREILRGIYFALRDRNWGTVPGALRERIRTIDTDRFRIEFECEHRQEDIHFAWRGVIEGRPDGTVRSECDGEARSDFMKSRIGFCVLHPIRECAGAHARQIRTGGGIVEGSLPRQIEPQIFGKAACQDLRGLAHEVEPGRWAELDFEGDVFEMEDQRNWTDASFKTYCTPLSRPFPVQVKPGERVRQVITLRLVDDPALRRVEAVSTEAEEMVTLSWRESGESGPMPEIGLGLASDGGPLADLDIERLRALRLDHVRHDVKLAQQSWAQDLERALTQCSRLGVGLELAVHLPGAETPDLAMLRNLLVHGGDTRPRLKRILVLREGEAATRRQTLEWTRGVLGDLGVPLGAGSDCNFCELNREQALGQLALEESDFVFWSINPQVHAVDSWSVMETIEAQGATVRSARAFAGNRSLVVSPVTLKQRFNPVATGPEPAHAPGELPSQVDARQLSLFAAAWTVGSVSVLAEAGVGSITYFETVGWRGIMARDQSDQHSAKFPVEPGMVFPIYLVISALEGFEEWQAVASDDPRRVMGWGLRGVGGRRRLLLANMTEHPVDTQVHGLEGEWHARRLDVAEARRAFHDPGSFWAMTGEPLTGWGTGRSLRMGGYSVVVADRTMGSYPYY